MRALPKYARHVQSEKETKDLTRRTHWSVPSAICLYHAAIDCFINEEVTLFEALAHIEPTEAAHAIQGNTLNAKKLDDFYSHRGLAGRLPGEVRRRTLLLIGLRNRLAHHWPQQRDIRDYPVDVSAALDDAKIERVNTSWAAQCTDVRLAKWAAEVTLAFVEEWWRQARKRFEGEWEFEQDRDQTDPFD